MPPDPSRTCPDSSTIPFGAVPHLPRSHADLPESPRGRFGAAFGEECVSHTNAQTHRCVTFVRESAARVAALARAPRHPAHFQITLNRARDVTVRKRVATPRVAVFAHPWRAKRRALLFRGNKIQNGSHVRSTCMIPPIVPETSPWRPPYRKRQKQPLGQSQCLGDVLVFEAAVVAPDEANPTEHDPR